MSVSYNYDNDRDLPLPVAKRARYTENNCSQLGHPTINQTYSTNCGSYLDSFLPLEMIKEILGFLKIENLKNLRLTCKKFSIIIPDFLAYKNPEIFDFHFFILKLTPVFEKIHREISQRSQDLYLGHYPLEEPSGLSIHYIFSENASNYLDKELQELEKLESNLKIKKIHFLFSKPYPVTKKLLSLFIQKFPHLEILDLGNACLCPDTFSALQNSKVKRLFWNNPLISISIESFEAIYQLPDQDSKDVDYKNKQRQITQKIKNGEDLNEFLKREYTGLTTTSS